MCAAEPGAAGGLMPEGPEIRIAADRVEKALRGCRLSDVYFQFDRLKRFQRELRQRRVSSVETRGKAMLTHFEGGLAIYSHNQLYGRWVVCRANRIPKSGRQLRLALHTEKKTALLYSATDIDVLTPEEIASHPFLSSLGPDVLSDGIDPVREQISSPAYQGRRLASLLLDQHFIAGIGNYLRSEILFVAGLHPRLRPKDISKADQDRLAEAVVGVARQSYSNNGITNDLEQAAALKAQGQTRSRFRHWVFGRGNERCRRCDTLVIEETIAGRRLYYCPVCQAGPSRPC